MNLKSTVLAAAAALILTPAAAMAATEQFPIQVTVEATVPSSTGLQISPVGDWAGQTQQMRWNIATQSLAPIQQQVDMKSGLGAINAYLTTEAMLTSAGNAIDLAVNVAGQELKVGAGNAVEVATSTEAAASKRAAVAITAAAPTGDGYVHGTYQGNVFMMFESGTP
ncbi:CS1 type fimbrial major subunit [Stenotrophomonas sp.]|uniref:CS1 type fimbrial major subunit n=1 Tax=Stenotrophomonas sp. TaxID=69392 RepID=UPI0028993E4F|nr:CS1 type fimbrial major subunit [Stenotrophomonas sp.]